ncbi:MAG TPA: PEGA domain-containing protein, partial [Polyangiaceae bacterium]
MTRPLASARHLCTGALLAAFLASGARAETPDAKEEARVHFERGLAHFDRREWSPALAEFLRSRALFPTRAATLDAAVCLREEARYDEALDLWEALLREFHDLSTQDRATADAQIAALRPFLGTIEIVGAEPQATLLIDGRNRGAYPAGPLRIGAGVHYVRAYKEGFVPFEGRVVVAGGQAVVVEARLAPLVQSGQLRVTEASGRTVDVVIDGVTVGKTPWTGAIATGRHVVVLRGDGGIGTPPLDATVGFQQVVPLTAEATPLEASARITPQPPGATVSVDGVEVGRGLWEGGLHAGSHRVRVEAEGFISAERRFDLARGERSALVVSLEPDPSSATWGSRHPSRFFAELDGAAAITPSLGGDLAGRCSAPCSAGSALGAAGIFRGGYELGVGLGFSIDAGYVRVEQTVAGRPATLTAVGNQATDSGTARDTLRLSGLLLGASASYHRGDTWTLLLRLGVGALLGTSVDQRSGTFTNSQHEAFDAEANESPGATYLYFAPEVRLGRRFGDHVEVSVGVEALLFAALSQPRWQDQNYV